MRLPGASLALLLALCGPVKLAASEVLLLPSGLEASLQEMLWDRPGRGLVYRFRFVAPALDLSEADLEALQLDLAHLCNGFALPRLANTGPVPSQIIISLADRASEFGVIDPDIAQIFEAYSVSDDTCIWEAF